MTNALELAWASGIIDGEGSIFLTKLTSKDSYSAVISIEMTHQETINKLYRIFQCGDIYWRHRNKKHKICHKIQFNGIEAINICRSIMPYLVTKRRQAILILEYGEKCLFKRGHNKKIEENIGILREIIYLELQELNKRGLD